MVKKKKNQHDVEAMLAAALAKREGDGIVSAKSFNVMVMGILAAVGVLVWDNTTQAPLQTRDTFAVIQQQNAEIKTKVTEMAATVLQLSQKLDQNQRQTSDQQAKLSAVDTMANNNREAITQLSARVGELERKGAGPHQPN